MPTLHVRHVPLGSPTPLLACQRPRGLPISCVTTLQEAVDICYHRILDLSQSHHITNRSSPQPSYFLSCLSWGTFNGLDIGPVNVRGVLENSCPVSLERLAGEVSDTRLCTKFGESRNLISAYPVCRELDWEANYDQPYWRWLILSATITVPSHAVRYRNLCFLYQLPRKITLLSSSPDVVR